MRQTASELLFFRIRLHCMLAVPKYFEKTISEEELHASGAFEVPPEVKREAKKHDGHHRLFEGPGLSPD